MEIADRPEPMEVQDLALVLNARWRFDVPPAAMEELSDALLAWVDGPELEPITTRTMSVVWNDVVEQDLREALEDVEADTPDLRAAARRALRDLAERKARSDVARAFVEQLATQSAHDQLPVLFCLCCIDESIERAPAGRRRTLALEAAAVATPTAGVSGDELGAALRTCAADPRRLPEVLATDERRRAVRARLERLASLGARSVPHLARELRAALRESPPDAASDPVWAAVCSALVGSRLAPGLN